MGQEPQTTDAFDTGGVAATPPPDEEELERVREIILGPDVVRQRLRKPEVDRLREILFGAQMEEYERRFADVQREMERVLGDLREVRDELADFEKRVGKQVESLERELRRTNDELRREIERIRAQGPMVQQLFTQVRQQEMLSRDLQSGVGEVRESLSRQERELMELRAAVGERHDQHERRLDALKRELRQAEDSLRSELRRVADRLDERKTDRKALAAMLIEVATRLETGSSVTGLLEELAGLPEE